MTGIYIHIPFCKQKCFYCDFYSETTLLDIPTYMKTLENQIMGFPSREVDSIYIGGGTPSLLSGEQVARLLLVLEKQFKVSKDSEITIEINPDSSDRVKLKEYFSAGINRISVGAQTVNDETLKRLGRLHLAEAAKEILRDAAEVGFNNISCDMMLALPYEDERDISRTIDFFSKNGVKHISAYILKISPDTPFGRNNPKGIPDDDRTADLYDYTVEELEKLGYKQYEISNFSLESYESRHNMKYWNCEEYIGLGAGAFSSIDNMRYHIEGNLKEYLNTFKKPSNDYMKGLIYDGLVGYDDYMILQLRTAKGLDLDEMYERYKFVPTEKMNECFKQYIELGLMKREDKTIYLTEKGFLVSNEILSGLLLAVEL